jgi:hypothetical protein
MRGRKKYFFDNPRIVAALNKSLIWFFTALLTSLLAFSCGLPTSEYLFSPIDFSYTGSNLSLRHDEHNIDGTGLFKGYEIYYRLFQNPDDAKDSLSSALKLASNYPNSPNTFMQMAVTSLSFRRMLQITSVPGSSNVIDSRPLIPVSDNSVIQFDLSMNTWSIDLNGSVVKVARNNGTTLANLADFSLSTCYNSTNLDYSGADSPDSVYIVLFAVAYGYSATSFSDVFSTPVFIPNSIENADAIVSFSLQ